MTVVLSRVDERLVHGQIITSWTKQLRVSDIYIIDDLIAHDDFMREVLILSAPSGLKFQILTVDEAAKVLESTSNGRIMLLFKTVDSALELRKSGFNLESLNLGNIASSVKRKKITKNISLSEEEINKVKELVGLGVEVYLQMLFTDSKVNVVEYI